MYQVSKYRYPSMVGVVFCAATMLFGCSGDSSQFQVTPTMQAGPEVQTTPAPQEEQSANWLRPADQMTMVSIPGGIFQMGSTSPEIEEGIELCQEHYTICNRWFYEREGPVHTVSLDRYWIDQTEVSNAHYRLCADAGVCTPPLTCKKGEPTFNDLNKADHPVVCVSWADAQTYCQWAGARLPSEAEWEYAYRGEERAIFAWGNEFDGSKLNYCDQNCSQAHSDDRYNDGYSHTAPVGSFPAGMSWSGVYNLSGNVSEWVADWFGDYSAEIVSNPLGPASGSEKMIKGCSWYYHPTYCRGALRPAVDPETTFDYLGFRCAASAVKNE